MKTKKFKTKTLPASDFLANDVAIVLWSKLHDKDRADNGSFVSPRLSDDERKLYAMLTKRFCLVASIGEVRFTDGEEPKK